MSSSSSAADPKASYSKRNSDLTRSTYDAGSSVNSSLRSTSTDLLSSWTTGGAASASASASISALASAPLTPLAAASEDDTVPASPSFASTSTSATNIPRLPPLSLSLQKSLVDAADQLSIGTMGTMESSVAGLTLSTSEGPPYPQIPPQIRSSLSRSNTLSSTTHVANDQVTSIIHEAARIGNWEAVNTLAQTHPASASYRCSAGLTPLHHACSRRCPTISVFYHLISAYPQAILTLDEKGWTPLHHGCRHKAPQKAIQLLLQMEPAMGRWSTKQRCKAKGRTALFYALRYDAPRGVKELLLKSMATQDVLWSDSEGNSVLFLVWDKWAVSFEGKRMLTQYRQALEDMAEHEVSWEKRLEFAKECRDTLNDPKKGGNLKSNWDRVNLLLKGAFHFSLEEGTSIDGSMHDSVASLESSSSDQHQARIWRILHATAAIQCHPTLFMMACVLHPEQARELDIGDLHGIQEDSSSSSGLASSSVDAMTALDLAARASTTGRDSSLVISNLLTLAPDAASIPNPRDNALPLHYMCENESKHHWQYDGAQLVYNAMPSAAEWKDSDGRTPLHRAATVLASRPTVSTSELDQFGSILHNLVTNHPNMTREVDKYGDLPMHCVARTAEHWDEAVEALHTENPAALSQRNGREGLCRCPLHLVALNPDAKPDLIQKVLDLHPRGASLVDAAGKLPLHLVCESGKTWERGMEQVYSAYQVAIRTPEDNERKWMPLHYTLACPHSDDNTIQKVLEIFQEAATLTDAQGKTPLHLAVESGKEWRDGLNALFMANPEAIEVVDKAGLIPFTAAALSYCEHDPAIRKLTPADKMDLESEGTMNRDHDVALTTVNTDSRETTTAQTNVLFHLIRSAPHILKVKK